VIVLNVLALAGFIYFTFRLQRLLHGWVRSAISEEIRRQDDRIQKRLERMEGQPKDVLPTDSDREAYINDYRIGKPIGRATDGS